MIDIRKLKELVRLMSTNDLVELDLRDKETAKTLASIDRQIASLQDKLNREQRELSQDQVEYENRKREETTNLLELGAGVFGLGRKKTLTSQTQISSLNGSSNVFIAFKKFVSLSSDSLISSNQVLNPHFGEVTDPT